MGNGLRIYRSRRLLAAMPLLCSGCIAFQTGESITATNANHLERVYIAKLADLTLLERIGALIANDPPFPITGAAVDSRRNLLWVNRQYPTGGRLTAGLEALDLTTGLTVLPTPAPPSEMADDGLDLKRIDPTLERDSHYSFVPNPRINADRFIIFRVKNFTQTHVIYVRESTMRIETELALPDIGGRHLKCCGGFGPYLMATLGLDQYAQERSLCVLAPQEGQLRIIRHFRLENGWFPENSQVDWQTGRWIVWESRLDRYARSRRLRVYEIPSLRVQREFTDPLLPETWYEGYSFGNHGKWVPGSSLVAYVPEGDDRYLMLFDFEAGQLVSRTQLYSRDMEEYCGWSVFCDPQGKYIGVNGCLWVQLFAVHPTARTQPAAGGAS